MSAENIVWPKKTHEFQNALMNSAVWNDFKFHDGDVVILTWGKSGTTWMQQIAAQLIHKGADELETHKLSPWVDFRILPPEALAKLEQQTHRRILKTHQTVESLVFSPKAKYIYVGRDGRDAVWSLHNHFLNLLPQMYDAFNNTPGRVGPPLVRPPESALEFFREWSKDCSHPLTPFWDHARGWWNIRHLPNVKLVHFNDLKADLAGEMRGIAAFLGISLAPDDFARAVSHCTFDYMKTHADWVAPRGGVSWDGGGATFINKGTNGRWRDALPQAESHAFEERARAELGADCAAWLMHGARQKATPLLV
jgi:aryl sulfotransferase